MFVAALLIITKTWKSSSVLSVNEWINKHPDKGTLFYTKKIELATVERRLLRILAHKYCYLHTVIYDPWVLSESRGNQEHLKTKARAWTGPQATEERIWPEQMISDHGEYDFEEKVKWSIAQAKMEWACNVVDEYRHQCLRKENKTRFPGRWSDEQRRSRTEMVDRWKETNAER